MRTSDWVFSFLIGVLIAFTIGQEIQLHRHTDIFEDVVSILKMDFDTDRRHERTDSLIIANINALYEHLGVEWEIRSVRRDTTEEK